MNHSDFSAERTPTISDEAVHMLEESALKNSEGQANLEGELIDIPKFEEVAMSLVKSNREGKPFEGNEQYIKWLNAMEQLADTDNETPARDMKRLSLDLDRVNILIEAGFIEEARSALTETTEALEATRYEDLFKRMFELRESILDVN